MGKSDNSLFTTKESRPITTPPRCSTSLYKRSSAFNEIGSTHTAHSHHQNKTNTKIKLTTESMTCNRSKDCANTNATRKINHHENEMTKKPKSLGGMINSLFKKFQSINSNISSNRSKVRTINSPSTIKIASIPAKRTKRDDGSDNLLYASLDSNDSNQSTTSMSMEFLGFDISNKNVDVSALLPTPKVSNTNERAAFVSKDLDIFMKENSLEICNNENVFVPKHLNPTNHIITDEALMTTDAQPPSLSVPARPIAMQRPRTLAEKRMILQQHNDISILIIENESTVYHELKKRERLGIEYDNTLVRSIQNACIPFTRDCWRAACWLSTSNNRFFYRTMIYDGEEIKLTGSRGNNAKKVAIEIKSNDLDAPNKQQRSLKSIWAECSKKCPPINDDIKINNTDTIVDDEKKNVQNENDAGTTHTKEKLGLLKRSRLCMFSREYLTPGPKCKKLKCKTNRKSSFDLEYGPLELVQLPTVQLEIWPQIGIPLADHIKPLLKTMPINTNVITPEWAKFAVSVVREAPKQIKHRRKYKKPEIEQPEPIIFTIPYENNERKILIRRRRRTSIVFNKDDTLNEHIETFYCDAEKDKLSFVKNIDPMDTLSVECGNILTNMIESIAITVNDTNFIKNDPDIDYIGKIIPTSELKASAKAAIKAEKDKSAKLEKTSKNKLM